MGFKARGVFLLLLLVFALSGCLMAGLGPKFTQPLAPEQDKAIIYVYRETVALTGHEVPGVKLNDQLVVKALPQLNYFPLLVEPGSYSFTPKLLGLYKTTPATIEAEAGKSYYLRFKIMFGHLEFAQVSEDQGLAGLAECYLLNPAYAVDSRVQVQ